MHFRAKSPNAQNARATGLIIANNIPGPLAPGGADPSIFIPVLGVTQAFGASLRAAAPVEITLQRNPLIRTGTTGGYARLYAPTAFASGSSVSHWDVSLTPNMLMEPFINTDLGSRVKNPDDLTLKLLADIGW